MKEVSLSALTGGAEEKSPEDSAETQKEEQWISLSSLRGAVITDDAKKDEKPPEPLTDAVVPAADGGPEKSRTPERSAEPPRESGHDGGKRRKKKRKKRPSADARQASDRSGAASPAERQRRDDRSPDITIMPAPRGTDAPDGKGSDGGKRGGTPLGPGQVVTF